MFLVLATQRTGSSMLVNILSQHPTIFAYGELLRVHDQEERKEDWYKISLEGKFGRYIHSKQFPSIARRIFLNHYIQELQRKSPLKTVGFKAMYNDLGRLPSLWDIAHKQNFKFIHLVRSNLLRTLLSHEIAKKTGVYNSRKSGNQVLYEIELNPKSIFQELEALEDQIELHRIQLREYNALEISYEQLVIEQEDTLKKVFGFLSVEYLDIQPKLRKQNRGELSQILQNYDDIAKSLKNTKFKHFLDSYI